MNARRAAAALLAASCLAAVRPARAAAPALCAVLTAPARVDVGQVFTIRMQLHNCGDTDLVRITPSLTITGTCVLDTGWAAAPAAAALFISGPVGATIQCPVALPPGPGSSAYTEFTWTMKGVAVGSVDLTFTAAGLEVGGSPGASVFAPDTVTVLVQKPAALSATLTVEPAGPVPYGSTVTVYLDVTDVGEAESDFTRVLSVTPTGSGAVSALSCPPLAGLCKDDPARAYADVASGGANHRTWTWLYRAEAPGVVTLVATAAGLDHNANALVYSAAAATVFAIPLPSVLSWTITGQAAITPGQDVVYKVRAFNLGTTPICITGLALVLDGHAEWLEAQAVVHADLADSLLPVCVPPWPAGEAREFTVRARVAAAAAAGAGLLTAAWTGGDAWTGIPVLPAGAGLAVSVTAGVRLVSGLDPNPWRPRAGPVRIGFVVPAGDPGAAPVARVEILTLLGEVVRVLADDTRPPGAYELSWDGRNRSGQPTAAGVVLVQIRAGNRREVRKLAVIR